MSAVDERAERSGGGEVAPEEVTIIGAGLVGSLLAVVLRHRGYRVTMYERWTDPRDAPAASAGRSINLVATARGLRALDALPPGIRERLLKLGTKVYGRVIHAAGGGDAAFQPYGRDDECNYSVSRRELNMFLLGEAEAAGATIKFGHKVLDVDAPDDAAEPTTLKFETECGAISASRCFGPVVAADGGGSAIRRSVGAFSATEEKLPAGYKEMTFPKDCAASLDDRGLHIWPRGTHFLMGLANRDGSFTGTIYAANEGATDSFDAVEASLETARAWLEANYADALPLLGGAERAARQLVEHPRGFLGTVRTAPWRLGTRVVLVGDAAHAIVPFFGQGMNCGFEDVAALADELATKWPPGGQARPALERALIAYEASRKPNADAIADLALENYVEMMAATADPVFMKRKAVEAAMERDADLGARFRSRYAMVCYGGGRGPGSIGYAAAQRLGVVQWAIVSELADGLEDPALADKHLDRKKAAALLDARLLPLQRELGVDIQTVGH
mmetsp:Transcript_18116/g.55737  ORF Transcript_18116/g.55737 Transcript_18116/m.55737 type:complete len:505 (-) Transcript_18116:80-1594(-)